MAGKKRYAFGPDPLIVADERTNAETHLVTARIEALVDPQARRDFWGLIRSLASEGTTILLTTHYLDEAEQLADRIAILHAGRVIAEGTLAELTQLFPPARTEYVEKKPTLEEIFLALTTRESS